MDIDYDFYRRRAATLRAQAMRGLFKLKAMVRFTPITIAAVAAFAVAAGLPVQAGGSNSHAIGSEFSASAQQTR
jgi:hypothetical protein